VFLNHGAFGACPRPVFEEYQRWQRELERQPVEFLARRLDGLIEEAKERLAAEIGARPENLVFVTNATSGMNVVARSLPLGPAHEVLATNHEYGAVDLLWQHVCARTGATYVRSEVGAGPGLVDELWRAVTERTRLISVSHLTSATAIVFPVEEICRRARERGILVAVDGAHAPGQLNLEVEAVGADFYAGNCHKWRGNVPPSMDACLLIHD
jgi:isopenicillin-N epimerase